MRKQNLCSQRTFLDACEPKKVALQFAAPYLTFKVKCNNHKSFRCPDTLHSFKHLGRLLERAAIATLDYPSRTTM